MMASPSPTLAISCLYLIFLWAGPRYMQDRQPFTLRKTLIVYNFSMVVLNFYIAKEVGVNVDRCNSFFKLKSCQECQTSLSDERKTDLHLLKIHFQLLALSHWLTSSILAKLDTYKNNNQFSLFIQNQFLEKAIPQLFTRKKHVYPKNLILSKIRWNCSVVYVVNLSLE